MCGSSGCEPGLPTFRTRLPPFFGVPAAAAVPEPVVVPALVCGDVPLLPLLSLLPPHAARNAADAAAPADASAPRRLTRLPLMRDQNCSRAMSPSHSIEESPLGYRAPSYSRVCE